MKEVLSILVFVSLTVSCHDNSKLSEEVALFRQRPVILTMHKGVMINGKENTIVDKNQQCLKYVVYNDSLDCTSCAINKMYLWNDFIEYAKPYNGRLKYFFIYSPSKKNCKNVEFILKNGNFNYPILLDTLNEFAKLNPHLPKNRVLHTFLLDDDNKVILVGNPLYNGKIEKMFYKIVEERLGKRNDTLKNE